jgi:hypothetical protein
MVVPQINLESLSAIGGKPKDYFLLEWFRLYEKYWDGIVDAHGDKDTIDACTGLILGTCPNKTKREDLWANYIKIKSEPKKTHLDASILTIGELWDYLNTTMEFTDEAYGGV